MNKVAILYYHRINELRADYNLTNVKPANFEDQMKGLLDNYDVVSIDDIYDGSAFKRDRNAVAITFDDGYKDVLNNAAPLLEAYGFKFTCLVTTKNIGIDKENWTDVVTQVAFEPNFFNEKCELLVNGERQEFKTDTIENRVLFYRSLQHIFKGATYEEWDDITNEICAWAGVSLLARDAYRVMDADDIKRIIKMGGVIGSHTVSHPFFSYLSNDEIKNEVFESKRTLEKIIGKEVYIFSYPFGDAPKRARAILDDCGYKITMTSNRGVTTHESDVMYLPRIGVRDCTRFDFEKMLENVFC